MAIENSNEGLKRVVGVSGLAITIVNFTIGAGVSHLFDHAYDNFPNAPGTIRNAAGTNTTGTFFRGMPACVIPLPLFSQPRIRKIR